MNNIEIFFIAVGLAMDAFAVAICKGIYNKKVELSSCIKVGLYFGFFQAIMPVIGYLFGTSIKGIVLSIDDYIVFCVLVIIGANMIYESFSDSKGEYDNFFNFSSLIFPALATSIDAFSVGITFALYKVKIIFSIIVIGTITFLLSYLGVYIGSYLSSQWDKKARLFGGIVLIFLGIKMLIENLV